MVRLFSLENQVGPQVPPVFLWHTWTDQTVPVENSLLLASALRKHGISLEMHIYPRGIHGLSTASHEVEAEMEDTTSPPVKAGCRWLKPGWNPFKGTERSAKATQSSQPRRSRLSSNSSSFTSSSSSRLIFSCMAVMKSSRLISPFRYCSFSWLS